MFLKTRFLGSFLSFFSASVGVCIRDFGDGRSKDRCVGWFLFHERGGRNENFDVGLKVISTVFCLIFVLT